MVQSTTELWKEVDRSLIARRTLAEKVDIAESAARAELQTDKSVYFRPIDRAHAGAAELYDTHACASRTVRMFGSNGYLGLASDPRVIADACSAAERYGTGIGGSPFLNGYTTLQRELEEATADLKGTEDCMVFPSGFCANLSWVSALVRSCDFLVFDREAHMSFREGTRLSGAELRKFPHNSIAGLEEALSEEKEGDKYVYVEGLYSMRGDVAPIKDLLQIVSRNHAFLVIDDAHGTGTLGSTGRGSTQDFGHLPNVLTMGTYSKALGSNGGFICGTRPLVKCLRLLAPSYMFSTALSPMCLAGALRAVKILMDEPERVQRLRRNARSTHSRLQRFGDVADNNSPIAFIRSGGHFDPVRVAKKLERLGCFVNAVAYPAVSLRDGGLRISISSEHDEDDITFLEACVEEALSSEDVE